MHFEQENGLKPHFGPFLALNRPFQGQQIFFQHLVHNHLLDIIIIQHYMQNRRKLMHINQGNDLKPHFGPFLALNGPFQGQQIFFRHLVHYYLLDIINIQHYMQNRRKLMHINQENDIKPHFGPFLAQNCPFLGQHIFFFKNPKTSLFLVSGPLPTCQISENLYRIVVLLFELFQSSRQCYAIYKHIPSTQVKHHPPEILCGWGTCWERRV